ncbi:MAG: hypothetical protein FWB86_04085 [Treponema sp.]|nr:hypothetical protein [Treponema sp.]
MLKKIVNLGKEKISSRKIFTKKTFPYLELLSDNSPKYYEDYSAEADILDSQIRKANVNNIAIVAKYGAGKSSVINTYLTKYRNEYNNSTIKNKNTRISLATFNNEKYIETDIERSILQQLLYSGSKDSMPNSKIKRTNSTFAPISGLKALVVTIFISASVLFGLEIGGAWLFRGKDITFLLFGIAFLTFFIIVKYLLHYGVLQKVKYKGIEADFNTENKDNTQNSQIASLINKFIDEVLYFFECTNVNLVIFEDLDRLPTTEIFVKLRELNTIINNSDICKKKVTFLYAVKDDLLKKEEERAKFFEFILPVIPIINPVTTGDILREKNELLKQMENKRKMYFHDRFIKGISWYITDMRILNNTFNDYIRMYNRIFEDDFAISNSMNNEKLFSLCLYKNLYPFDYSLLEKNNRLIPLIINMEKLRSNYITELNNSIKRIKTHIEELNTEKNKSFEELKIFFIGQITGMQQGLKVNSNIIETSTITTFNNLDFSIIKHPVPTLPNYYNLQYHYIDLQGKKEILTPWGEHYLNKENNIIEKTNNGINKLNIEIEDINVIIQNYKTTTLSQIVEKYGIDFCFDDNIKEIYENIIRLKYINEKELFLVNNNIDSQILYLRFLVVNDYIDENYLTYITNYKAQKITPKDYNFIMSVQRQEDNFEYIPDNIDEIIKRLDDEDFKHISILNKNIITNIEKIRNISKDERSKKYENIINLLANVNNEATFNIIRLFLETSNDDGCNILLEHIIPIRPTLFSEISIKNTLTENKLCLLILNIIKNTDNYIVHNIDKRLSLFISEYDDYLLLFQRVGDEKKIIQFIKEISPCFLKLSNIILNKNIQQYIIDNNHYAINLENLEVIYNINVNDNENDFYKKNYGYIMSSDNKNVQKYITNNIEKYVTKVLLNEKITCLEETQDDIEIILFNEELDIATRKEIIKKSKIKIDDIPRFNEELYNTLLKTKSIIPKWSTLFYVFEMIGCEPVIDYLKHETEIIGEFKIEEGAENTPIKLINEMLQKLSAIELKKLTEAIPKYFMLSELQTDMISDDILSIFIEEGKISYQNDDFNIIHEKLGSLCQYIIQHNNSIIENFNNFFNPIISLLIDEDITNNIILTIINCIGINLEIKKLLIQKCDKIIDINKNEKLYADFFINNKIVIPSAILWQFIKTTIISKNNKIDMLMQSIENIDRINEYENLKKYVNTLSKDTGEIINIDPIFEKTEQNEILLMKLKEKEFLTYSKVKNKDEYSIKINTIT